MNKRMMLLVNPNAGKGGYKSVLGEVLKVFCDAGIEPTVFFTRGPAQAPELVREHATDYDIVACMGGDGTLSEVTAGVVTLSEKRPIGYIPLGTANDVARTLGLPNKAVEAAKHIVNGRPFAYDLGDFGADGYFTYVAAFGAFTEVSYGTPQETKHALGHMAYMLEGIRQLPKLKHYHAIVEFDDTVVEDDFIYGAVTNTTSVAGLVRLGGDDISLSDGMFEVLLVRKPQDVLDLGDIISTILSSDFSAPQVIFRKSSEVRIFFTEEVAWTRDGEDGGKHRDIVLTNHHPGVEILV